MGAIEYLRLLEREFYKRRKRARLTNKKPTIIASNCVGTMIYQDMELPVCSPTINLMIKMNDFVRFAENLEWYLRQPLCEIEDSSVSCPVGILGDIKIYFGHYDTWEQAARKWKLHLKRVDLDNLFFIGCEKDGCTYDILKQFDNLPYENKVVLTKKVYPEFASACYIHGFEDWEEQGNLIAFRKGIWLRRYMEEFDYVTFLNGKGSFCSTGKNCLQEDGYAGRNRML